MTLIDRFLRRGRHAAGPRLLTGRRAQRTAARIEEARAALPTVVERDMAARRAHIRAHWRLEDADTGLVDLATVRARLGDEPDPEPELVRPYVQAGLHRMQGGC